VTLVALVACNICIVISTGRIHLRQGQVFADNTVSPAQRVDRILDYGSQATPYRMASMSIGFPERSKESTRKYERLGSGSLTILAKTLYTIVFSTVRIPGN
jgi:hypothetical protein